MGVTLWMAMSLNGMTARENQSEDFLGSVDWNLFLDLVRGSDALVWGRVTHELFEPLVRPHAPDLPILAVTRNPDFRTGPASLRASSPAEAVAILRAKGTDAILLAGGATLNGAFVEAQLVDEVVLALEPVIVSRGIPLLRGDAPDLRLTLADVERVNGQTLRVRYRRSS